MEYLKSLTSFLTTKFFSPLFQGIFYLSGSMIYRLSGRVSRDATIELSQIQKVLVVRLDEIGDMVMMSPFLRELRANLPLAFITLIVKPDIYKLVENCPYVDQLLVYNWKTIKLFKSSIRFWRALLLAKRYLWKQKFDIAIIPRWDVDSYYATYLTFLSGSMKRFGFSEHTNDRKERMNKGYDKFLTHPLMNDSVIHEVERNLYILKYLGFKVQNRDLELWCSNRSEKEALALLTERGVLENKMLIAIAPGASHASKCWPVDRFLEIGNWLIENYHASIMIIGGKKEFKLGGYLDQKLVGNVLNVVGKTNLIQTATLIKQSHLFIGNDSGPAHIAAACNVPVLTINRFAKNGGRLHPQSPNRFSPWGSGNIVLQPEKTNPPCTVGCDFKNAHCILNVPVDKVKIAIKKLLITRVGKNHII